MFSHHTPTVWCPNPFSNVTVAPPLLRVRRHRGGVDVENHSVADVAVRNRQSGRSLRRRGLKSVTPEMSRRDACGCHRPGTGS